MSLDAEAKKILGGLWAESGDRTDPDDAGLTPALDRADGWPDSFSMSAGDTPRRRVMNQIFRELQGAATDGMRQGLRFWDAEVDYLENATVTQAGIAYRATVATGPATSNATDPATVGQTVWTRLGGQRTEPDAPDAPIGSSDTVGSITWQWNCPLDNSDAITGFDFRWRVPPQTAWTVVSNVTYPFHQLTSVTIGQTIEVQVRARNSIGAGPWSASGTFTLTALPPGGGATMNLVASARDQGVFLEWDAPSDGGRAIESYRIQWRSGTQSYSSARQAVTIAGNTEYTVSGLTNGTEYTFRVFAFNGELGPASEEVQAIPTAGVSAPDRPAAPVGRQTGTELVEFRWGCPLDNGARVTSFNFRWRLVGGSWTTINSLTYAQQELSSIAINSEVQAQVQATNSAGTSAWSPTGSFTIVLVAPGGGTQFSLMASGRNESVILSWNEPDDGGTAITSYRVQWRSGTQAYTTGRQATATDTEHTVDSLTNGTEYTFRVFADNGVEGPASTEKQATPVQGSFTFTSSQTFEWPWGTSMGQAILTAGSGGGGGGGGGGASTHGIDSGLPSAPGSGGGGDNSGGSGGAAGAAGSSGGGSGGSGGDSGSIGGATRGGGGGGGAGGNAGNGGSGGAGGSVEEGFGIGGRAGSGGGGGGSGYDGGDSSIAVGGVTHTTDGGSGGGGGGGGGGESDQGNTAGSNGNIGGGGSGGGSRGTGAAPNGSGGGGGGNGGTGQAGEQTTVNLTGLSLGDDIDIVVGGGGSGGGGGARAVHTGGHSGSSGSSGTGGSVGSVTLTPLY